jgi:MFS family permease
MKSLREVLIELRFYIRQYTHLPYPGPDADKATKALFVLPGWQQSLLTGILSCGTFFGALIAGDVADRIGRRWTIISGCLTFIVGCILETASTTLAVMVVGRLIAGAGVGFISAISKRSDLNYSVYAFTNSVSYSYPIYVRNCSKEGPWCLGGRLSIVCV